LGGHLVPLCEREGMDVRTAGTRDADLTDPDAARRLVAETGADRVAHLAADVSVPRSWREPLAVLRVNHLTTLNVLEAVRLETPGAAVLVASSSEAYGRPTRLPVTEDHPLRPQNPYAASKGTSDLVAGFYGDAYDQPVARARAFNHAGPGQREEYAVSDFARRIALAERDGESEVTVTTGDPASRRDFLDVRDVAHAYWSLLDGGHEGAFNVCSGRSTSVEEVIAGLGGLTTLTVHRETDPALVRHNEVPEIVGSNDRIRAATGWEPELPFERTLADTLDWWRRELRQ
jgi:GDP-4-dehydro-6-deoxy-D-mannose reductase